MAEYVAGDYVWQTWVTGSATTCTSTTYTADGVWAAWLDTTSSTTSNTCTAKAWLNWNEPVQLSQEQRAALEEQRRIQREEAQKTQQQREEERKKREEERKIVRERAKRLLMESLDAEQKRQYEKDKCFYVLSEKGDRRYRIKQGSHGNVELVSEEGRVVHRYCAAPTGRVPEEDAMLAQKLFLELNEQAFLAVANVS